MLSCLFGSCLDENSKLARSQSASLFSLPPGPTPGTMDVCMAGCLERTVVMGWGRGSRWLKSLIFSLCGSHTLPHRPLGRSCWGTAVVAALPLLGAVRQAQPPTWSTGPRQHTPPDYHTPVQGNSHIMEPRKFWKAESFSKVWYIVPSGIGP
jgi:hypothetical protein